MTSRKNIPVTEVTDVIKGLEGSFEQRMKAFEDRLNQGGPVSNLNQLAADFQIFKESFLTELELIKTQINSLIQITDDIDSRSRRKFLLFRGVDESQSENSVEVVVGIIKSRLHLNNINNNHIKSCFRLGNVGDKKPRPLLVKFDNLGLRSDVWLAKKALKGSSISLSEFLTPRRREIFKEARSVFGMKSCWSHDCNIYLKLPQSEKIKLSSLNQLQEQKSKFQGIAGDDSTGTKSKYKSKSQRRGMQTK